MKRRDEYNKGARPRYRSNSKGEKIKGRDKFIYKTDPARIATKVKIPASLDGPKSKAALFEGLGDADGLGTDPVGVDPVGVGEDPAGGEGLAPVALDLNASNVLSAVGLTAKTIPALQWAPCLQ